MIVDSISVPYSSFEDLLERQQVVEKRVLDYIEKHPIADNINSTVRIFKDKFILNIDLIKE